jgi:nuclear mRNA export protein SAC3
MKSALIVVKKPGTKRVDHSRAVKMYERAAGDKTLPSDLRPPEVLKVNFVILLLHYMPLIPTHTYSTP